jgi:c-di-GMP-binding flagellar brake protein YcgR
MEGEARRAGADHYLRKPIDEPRFLDEIRKFVPIRDRLETRVPLDAPITIWRDGEPSSGRVTNLSKGGIFVSGGVAQPVGGRLEISFQLPNDFSGKVITAEVMVVRVSESEPQGFACRFFQISAASRLSIEEFVERAGARQIVG